MSDIPQMDVGAFYRAHPAEIDAAVARTLASGWYILGRETAAFEAEFAAACGCAHGIGVANGTEALTLALMAAGVRPGDIVATVSHTAVATVAAIALAGARPLLVDIDPRSFTLDPDKLAQALGAEPGVRAVVVVHLYGHAADMDAIGRIAAAHGAVVVEDCAQAHGAILGGRPVGSFGAAAAFSFYPTKNLGAFGDGGFIATRDAGLADRARRLREYGWRQRYVSESVGMNSRLDEIQAAILRARLPFLAAGNARRREIAAIYDRELAGLGLGLPRAREGVDHVYHQYVVRHARRDPLQAALKARGVGTNIHYPVPVHRQPAYEELALVAASGLSCSEAAAQEVLSLPMYPELQDESVARCVAAVKDALAGL